MLESDLEGALALKLPLTIYILHTARYTYENARVSSVFGHLGGQPGGLVFEDYPRCPRHQRQQDHS